MGLNTEERQDVVYFTGYEVEHTVCHGMFTLFVVGTPPVEDILRIADDSQAYLDESKRIKHIYFGTSQSFNPKSISHQEYKRWDDVIVPCLKEDYWVTLDFDVKHVEGVLESCYCEYPRFVPMISCKIPYINQLNYNATLKLDDLTWGKTNPGVWTHHLQSLMSKDKYTHWDQYTQDTPT
jgi:hypothetical protein